MHIQTPLNKWANFSKLQNNVTLVKNIIEKCCQMFYVELCLFKYLVVMVNSHITNSPIYALVN